jgi:versiconal hemiacetal acetate reductase
MVPYSLDSGIGLIPWAPLARGVLARPWSGRNTLREKTDDAVINLVRGRETPEDEVVISHVKEIAERKGISMAQVALTWLLGHLGTNPIVGMNTKERIDEAVASISIRLTEEEVDYLEEPYIPRRM